MINLIAPAHKRDYELLQHLSLSRERSREHRERG